ncbi:MAG: hypothetical protein Q8N70_08410, partial [Deltaproteobacteria bacterium]|nr:hypothetical protein [Deltaproteobacteria bacterium]
SPCACLRVAASAKAGEGARGRGNLKGELFTLTLTLSRQGRGNYFKISKSEFGWLSLLDEGNHFFYSDHLWR